MFGVLTLRSAVAGTAARGAAAAAQQHPQPGRRGRHGSAAAGKPGSTFECCGGVRSRSSSSRLPQW
jgi:hypothetical protein